MAQSLPMLFMLVALVAMWFFMSRSQKKQQQERKNLLENMKAGDEVVTIGGLHGVLSEVNTEKSTVIIDCEGIFLEFDRSAIRTVRPGTVASVETQIEPADVEDATSIQDETKE
ncbi:preprotein translocase subunit YajC [Enterococcus casseliflavus]|uniref:preprotein translocase subunit YajC n=1 Tax=Enterococcus casseliflavus TaxID=37734 RepID=UPI0012E0ECD0|nr:preprotein translocase subunit YajC [Enterococcus casseliflavus]MUN75349.1 preprotein translocase subunit YajC [Enterococcus casseliflavus]MUN97913.1 preprotein translocase subunit YajC [Enterococcus casseliflavus]